MNETPPAAPGEAAALASEKLARPSVSRRERVIALAAVALLVVGGSMVAGWSSSESGNLALPAPEDVRDGLPIPSTISNADEQAAQRNAGCTLLLDGDALQKRDHLPADAPPAAALYPEHRPANSGQHFPTVLDVPDQIASRPIDERLVLHNMEHGSVVVWFDAAQVDPESLSAMQVWMRERRALGFESSSAGGIFVSPAQVISSGQRFALRAWGVALDCDRFDVTVADAFLANHWGTRGASPEAALSPFPKGVMGESSTAV
ncbi:MAG: hypothetical protein ACI867_001274 [Glaciecola sp.]|jgi:hypothetical protein